MPFKSLAQSKKCFAMKSKGLSKDWNCEEWAKKTNYKGLPDKKCKNCDAPKKLSHKVKMPTLVIALRD